MRKSFAAWQKKATKQVKLASILWRYKESGTIACKPGSGQLNAEEQMHKIDETTVLELKQQMKKEGFDASKALIR